MRRLSLFITWLLAFHLPALAETVDLGIHGQLKFEVPEGWELQTQQIQNLGVNLTIRPKSPINAAGKVTIAFLEEAGEASEEEQQKRFEKVAAGFASGSVEQKVEVKKFQLKSGVGFYACFTDSSLVGKPSQPRNYKVIAPGMLVLSPRILVSATLFTDDKTSQEFTDLIKMIESLTLVNKL